MLGDSKVLAGSEEVGGVAAVELADVATVDAAGAEILPLQAVNSRQILKATATVGLICTPRTLRLV
jgi:hypothetical protein